MTRSRLAMYDADGETGGYERRRQYRHPVPPHELSRAIPGIAGTGLDRPRLQDRADVAGEHFHRGIALVSLAPKGCPQDEVDVGRQVWIQPRRRRNLLPARDHVQGLRCASFRFVRGTACQHFVQHRAERVDIRGRRVRGAAELLRTRVGGREHPLDGLRRIAGLVEQPRNAKIQQLREARRRRRECSTASRSRWRTRRRCAWATPSQTWRNSFRRSRTAAAPRTRRSASLRRIP